MATKHPNRSQRDSCTRNQSSIYIINSALVLIVSLVIGYRPVKSSELAAEQLNSSSSSNSMGQVEDPDQQAGQELQEIQFTSPMKRIMELIGHHQPLIVVNSDSRAAANSQEQIQTNNQPEPQQTTATAANPIGSADRQQWTLVSPGTVAQPAILTGQQQQLIQSTVPFEQYYIAPNQILPDGGPSSPFALLPNIAFSPASTFQQLAQVPYGQQQSQQSSQIAAAHQQLSSVDDKAQPVFLTSYVPEIPVHMRSPSVFSPVQQQQQPNSIQQIQQLQQPQQQITEIPSSLKTAPAGGDQAGHSGDSGDDKDLDDKDSKSLESQDGGDDDEPVKTKRSQNDQEADTTGDEPASSGGSSTYEDKYDSDKEEPRSSKSKTYSAEPSGNVINGLANVGLNDDCLQCICRAASGCDHLLRCITRGADEKYCGPFQLTEEYWNKAGSPGDSANNFISFEDCANDADCAVETVTNYMKKYHKDCDSDDNITCMDYARLHRLQPGECDNTDKLVRDYDAYWAKFQRCAEGYNRTRNGDDEDI